VACKESEADTVPLALEDVEMVSRNAGTQVFLLKEPEADEAFKHKCQSSGMCGPNGCLNAEVPAGWGDSLHFGQGHLRAAEKVEGAATIDEPKGVINEGEVKCAGANENRVLDILRIEASLRMPEHGPR
jgi:hypothetical protein